MVWVLRYVVQPSSDISWMNKDPFAHFNDERHKLTTRLEIQKDDIQAVLPIAKVKTCFFYANFLFYILGFDYQCHYNFRAGKWSTLRCLMGNRSQDP